MKREPGGDQALGIHLALRQGTDIYIGPGHVPAVDNVWVTLSFTGLTATNFGRMHPTAFFPQSEFNPNFTSTAPAPLEFGLFTSGGPSGVLTRASGVDNYFVTLTIPEPASVVVLVTGAALLMVRRRRMVTV